MVMKQMKMMVGKCYIRFTFVMMADKGLKLWSNKFQIFLDY